MAQGGKFKAGFASGFLSSGLDVGTTGYGGFVGRTTIMAVVGGTASEIGGGKFSNGAVSGAFVHMFNAERVLSSFNKLWKNYPPDNADGSHAGPSSDSYAKNQCAIRLSVSLEKAGFNLSGYTDPLTSEGYARGAKSLADYLWREIGRPTIMSVNDFASSMSGSRGIFFELKATSHDISHIDLNNYGQTGSGFYRGGVKEIWYWRM